MAKRIGKYKISNRESALNLTDGGNIGGALTMASRTITSGGDAVDATGIGILFVDKSGGHVTIGGFTGGVEGQVLHLVSLAKANNLIIENEEGGGNQDIHIGNGDLTLTATSGGVTLVCNGTKWMALQTSDAS